MDPLSGAASVIAVVGAIITTVKASHAVISGLRDAPKELQMLARELIELKAVLEDVMVMSKLNPGQTQSTDPTVTAAESAVALPSSTLSDHICHVQSIVASVDELVRGFTTVPGSNQIAVKRVGWMIQGKKVMKMRDEIASVKLNISILLISKTLYQLSSLDSRIARFETMSAPRHQEVMVLLQRCLRERTQTVGFVEEIPVTSQEEQRALHDQTGVTMVSARRVQAAPEMLSHTIDRSSALIQSPSNGNVGPTPRVPESLETRQRARNPRCKCRCHRLKYRTVPLIFTKAFGNFVIGATGHCPYQPTCEGLACSGPPRPHLSVGYYFPSWLLSQIILFAYTRRPYGNPSFGLHMRNLLPEHSPILAAITEGRIADIKSMFESRMASPDDMEPMAWTTLTWAIHKNKPQVCKFLLDAGASPTLEDGFGGSAIDFAWLAIFERQVNPSTQRYLQENFLPRDDEGYDKYEFSKVHRVILQLEAGDLDTLLSQEPYDVINSTDALGKTALLWAARRGDLEALVLLLRHGANPNISDAMLRSPLHMAARSRSAPVIETLMKYGGDPHALNYLNELPAHYACYEGNTSKLVKPFVDAKININQPSKYGRTMLDIAVQWNYPVLVSYLIECGAAIDGSGSSNWKHKPLGRAVLYKAYGVLETLLDRFPNINFIDENRDNILHFLAKHGDKDIIHHFRDFVGLQIDACYADALNHDLKSPDELVQDGSDREFARAFVAFLDNVRYNSGTLELRKEL